MSNSDDEIPIPKGGRKRDSITSLVSIRLQQHRSKMNVQPSLTSVQSLPMIRITDTEPTLIRKSSKERKIPQLGGPQLGAPLDEDGIRVIFTKRNSDQRSVHSGGVDSDRSTVTGAAATIVNLRQKDRSQFRWKHIRRRLLTVVWVNLSMRYRTKVVTLLEIFLPVLVMFIFISSLTSNFAWDVGRRSEADMMKRIEEGERFKVMNEDALRRLFCDRLSPLQCNGTEPFIFYTSTDSKADEIMENAIRKLDLNQAVIRSAANEGELLKLCLERYRKSQEGEHNERVDPIGIIFTNEYINNIPIPITLNYVIRTFIAEIANTAETFPFIEAPSEDRQVSPYIYNGFVGLQNAIDKSYLDMVYERKRSECDCFDPQVFGLQQDLISLIEPQDAVYSLQMFPFALYLDLKVRYFTWSSIMLSIVLGYFCTTFFSVKQVIIDLDSGILELLKLHGLVPYMHWISLLLHDIFLRAIGCIFMTWIMFANVSSNDGVLKYDNPFLVWVFFFMHGVAKTALGFFVAVFFSKPTFGGVFAFMISFLSFFIPINMYTSGQITNRFFNFLLCLLFPNWCLANGLYHFLKFESFKAGASWSSSAVWTDENYVLLPLTFCLAIFFLSTIMYMTLTIYVDRVSLKYLSPKESYFFFVKPTIALALKIWRKIMRRKDPIEAPVIILEDLTEDFIKPKVYETEEQLACKVKCRNLTHYYTSTQIALDDVSLNFYRDQITVILGYSGSGKTTLLHILAGLVSPATGSTRVVGVDPATNKLVRKFVGFCPQKLILFQTLSVQEHMRLACMLHCNSYKQAKSLSDQLLVRFNLWEYQQVGVRSLTDGQRKKLAIAMALSTNPPVLILDEPTFGMDVAARHEIWTLLRFLRQGRTIIVTTSTMDEADTYSDKIVLLTKGRVVCYGSPSFLKRTYNTGSYLKLRRGTDNPFFANRILSFLHGIDEGIQEVHLKGFENQDQDIYLSLPTDKNHKFSTIITALEDKKNELEIDKISMTHATLGGIFYKLAKESHLERGSLATLQENRSDHSRHIIFPAVIPELPSGIVKDPNFCLTMTALFTKQNLYMRQKHWSLLMEYVFPIILVIFFIRFCETFVASQPGPTTRPLTANTYPRPPIPILLEIYPEGNIKYWQGAFDEIAKPNTHRNTYFVPGNPNVPNRTAFNEMLKPTQSSFVEYQSQVVTAFLRDKGNFIGMYASNALHSAPIAQNMLSNVLLNLMSYTNNNNATRPYRIRTSNRPIAVHSTVPTGTVRDATNALGGMMFGFLLALIAGSSITFCIIERTSGVKSLQLMTGVNRVAYWMVIYLSDLMINFILSNIIMVIFFLFDSNDIFTGFDTYVTIYTMVLLYLCWASLPFGYFLSSFMSNEHNGYGQFICFHILFGSLPEIANYLLLRNEVETSAVFSSIRFAFLVLPSYAITAGFVHFCDQVSKRNFCLRMPSDSQKTCTFFDNSGEGVANLLFPPNISAKEREEMILLEENDIYFHQCCDAYCKSRGSCFQPTPYFTWESGALDVSSVVIALSLQGFLYWFLLMLMEFENFTSIWSSLKASVSGDLDVTKTSEVENETVEMHYERQRINDILEYEEPITDAMLVANLSKYFGKKKALQHVYFTAKKGSIVGVLGPPQSSKTVLLRILCGDLPSARGSIIIVGNINLQKQRTKFHEKIAYCPQTNPILEYLTGFQMMQLIARLRGIPVSYVDIQIRQWLELLGFEEHDWLRKCKDYSPGTQRRLACAMTLIGDCSVLMFDDPTRALDPLEHLTFWNLLTQLQKRNQTIIFTSSRAEECSQVTDKFIILGNGQVIDIGLPIDIVDRYATGWILMVRYHHNVIEMGEEKLHRLVTDLHEFVKSTFSPFKLKDDQDSFILYHILDSVKTLSYMYEHMEIAKSQLPELIDDFFIADANLDDVIGNLPTFSNLYHHRSTGGSQHSLLSVHGSI